MSAQPHDRASQADLAPVHEEPQPQRTAIVLKPNLSYRARRRAAAKHARAALYELRSGGYLDPAALCGAAFTSPFVVRRRRQLPWRSAGRILVMALVLAVIGATPELGSNLGAIQNAERPPYAAAKAGFVELRVAKRAPAVFAPAEPSTGDTVNRRVAVLGETDLSAKSVAIEAVTPPVAAEPRLFVDSAFATHVVTNGETLGAIAERYRLPVAALAVANIIDPRLLPAGRRLRIPQSPGVPHTVREGETVETIAAQYGVPPETVRAFVSNRLDGDRVLLAGEEIFVPGAMPADLPTDAELAVVLARPVAVVRDNQTNIRTGPATAYERLGYLGATTPVMLLGRHDGWFNVLTVEGSQGWVAADLLDFDMLVAGQLPDIVELPPLPTPAPRSPVGPEPAPPPAVDRWVWPASGEFSSGFGYRKLPYGGFHNGIDIANGRGTPIRAARSGRVTAAGWCGGYGYCVKIDHGDGFVSEYGHLYAQPVVDVGQSVQAGQKIGGMGRTYGRGGYATGVHLHFTIKLGGKAVNPLRYLP